VLVPFVRVNLGRALGWGGRKRRFFVCVGVYLQGGKSPQVMTISVTESLQTNGWFFFSQLIHRRFSRPNPRWTTPNRWRGEPLISLVVFVFSPVIHRPVLVNNPVHIKRWADSENVLLCLQFIERTGRMAVVERWVVRPMDNPRRLGKGRDQAGWSGSSDRGASPGEAVFTSSSGGVRTPSQCEWGTWRQGAMRNRSDPSQVARERFGSGRIAVTPWVASCYCGSARCGRLWRAWCKPGPPSEKRRKADKGSARIGKNTGLGRSREKLPETGDVKNDTAGLWKKRNSRVKRRDPWFRANAPPTAVADREPSGQDANAS